MLDLLLRAPGSSRVLIIRSTPRRTSESHSLQPKCFTTHRLCSCISTVYSWPIQLSLARQLGLAGALTAELEQYLVIVHFGLWSYNI
jgi:hypothetical protein